MYFSYENLNETIRRQLMEELIETMASKVDNKEIVGYLVSTAPKKILMIMR